MQSTPHNSNPLGKSKKVRVIGSLKQIDKKISLWMGMECKYRDSGAYFELGVVVVEGGGGG